MGRDCKTYELPAKGSPLKRAGSIHHITRKLFQLKWLVVNVFGQPSSEISLGHASTSQWQVQEGADKDLVDRKSARQPRKNALDGKEESFPPVCTEMCVAS